MSRIMLLASANILPFSFTSLPLKISCYKTRPSVYYHYPKPRIESLANSFNRPPFPKRVFMPILRSSVETQDPQDPIVEKEEEASLKKKNKNGDDDDENGEGRDWTTSILLFLLWGGIMYYVFNLAPNQTPSMDKYFLMKLLNLKGDDGFVMNKVLVSLWYMMGLWSVTYSMLLLPTGRSSKGKAASIPIWPFLVLSFFGGAYVLIPYFVIWSPPAPKVKEDEVKRWPLNVTESKITAGITLGAGLGLVIYAGLANGDGWKEFYQYFRQSKLVHATSMDFALQAVFAPFWVYNDMTARKSLDKGKWLLLLSPVPLLGPLIYLLFRAPITSTPLLSTPSSSYTDRDKTD
ncbi:uncharacterized protein LOC124937562 [Impatiens glandulifera]|uniref:uncharacterized protein LOC124937562 n=1 Tax=Impatiens glandulifera TaxID=253017 RepID=UPI001FB08663|nr:uncharacterized protein LOC124937562 [Impatiens glandulifera]